MATDRDFEISGGTLVKYTGSSPAVTIPDGVSVIGEKAFFGNKSLESVTIPEGVTAIGDFAFAQCAKLKGVTIPGSITAFGKGAFLKCDRLKNVSISQGIAAIGHGAFFACGGLENITIPASVKTIGYKAFFLCDSLKSITIPEGVKRIESKAFAGCMELRKVTVLGDPIIDDTVFPAGHTVIFDAPRSWKEKYPFIRSASASGQTTNPRPETKIYGIDLGTTYSVIAALDDNRMPKIIVNQPDNGSNSLASAVYFPEGGGEEEIVVGEYAKEMRYSEPDRVVEFVKRYIGKPDAPTYEFYGRKYDPITISSLILKRLKAYADEQGHDVHNVVITCPAYFGNEEKAATKQAGEIAGLNVVNIVHEPTAAALNYCAREFREDRKILVYDLGGGTLDITLLDFIADGGDGKPLINVIKTDGDDRLGGIDWDQRLFDLLCRKYAEVNDVEISDMDDGLRAVIRAQVEPTKRRLSQFSSKRVTINYDGDSTGIELTRREFEESTRDLTERAIGFVRGLLSDVALTPEDVDVVLLVGGSTQMPMIQNAIKNIFPGKVRVEEPDLAVAKGAALAAALEWDERIGEVGTITVRDKLTRSLGTSFALKKTPTYEFAIQNLLFVGDEIPAKAKHWYSPLKNNQRSVLIQVYENASHEEYIRDCFDEHYNLLNVNPELKIKRIGAVRLPLPPNTPKNYPFRVVFRSSTKGLEVAATDMKTGESVEALIESDSLYSKERIEDEKKHIASIHPKAEI